MNAQDIAKHVYVTYDEIEDGGDKIDFIETLAKRIWDKACEAQRLNTLLVPGPDGVFGVNMDYPQFNIDAI